MMKLLTLVAATASALTVTLTSAQAYDHRTRYFDSGRHVDVGRHHFVPPMRCVAEARRMGGTGPTLPGVRGVGFGRDACREAMFECRRELAFVKSTGLAPFASCVVSGGRRW
jgi:hypothetical protein